MLAFFPSCQEDELLYSVLARYHQMSGNPSLKQTLYELFGSASKSAIADLPTHLERLCSKIPGHVYSPPLLIDEHTLFRYYAPFVPIERVDAIREAMASDAASSIHNLIGTRGGGVKNPEYLRFCPLCASRQEIEFGQPLWTRLHQVPGVLICPIHFIRLNDSFVSFSRWNNQRKFEVLTPGCSGEEEVIDSHKFTQLLFIADQSRWLLNRSPDLKPIQSIRQFYLSKLKQRGYLTNSGKVRFQEFIPQFIEFYGNTFLDAMQSSLVMGSRHTWLHKLLHQSNSFCHPLRHILLLGFLGETLETVFDKHQVEHFEPFGQGPFLCKSTEDYREDATRETQRRGTLANETLVIVKPEVQEYRGIWLAYVSENAGMSRTELRYQAPKIYAFLYRHDRQWLSQSLPPKRRITAPGAQINWNSRDEWLSKLIMETVHELKKHPVRVTRTRIGRQMNKEYLFKRYLERLPKCRALLNDVVESVEEFRLRYSILKMSTES